MVEPVDYQAVLADLKARRARLDDLIARIEADIFGQATEGVPVAIPATASSGFTGPIHADTFFGLPIAEAAKKFLKMAGRAQNTTAIADALARGGMKRPQENNLFSILVRAAKGREVVKVGKGLWGLSEWYPKPPKDSGEPRVKPVTKRSHGRANRKPRAYARAKAKPEPPPPQETNGAMGTSSLILEVLRAAGKPLHTKEITKLMQARGSTATKATIEGQLARWAKRERVKRTAPSTFSL
jgi:hypothetical protein